MSYRRGHEPRRIEDEVEVTVLNVFALVSTEETRRREPFDHVSTTQGSYAQTATGGARGTSATTTGGSAGNIWPPAGTLQINGRCMEENRRVDADLEPDLADALAVVPKLSTKGAHIYHGARLALRHVLMVISRIILDDRPRRLLL